jgi:hypothetical protein
MAEDLLIAWISGDAVRVNQELERSISVPIEACDAGEEERRRLIKVVAGRMRNCPDLLESHSQSPELKLCVCLLGRLVSPWPDRGTRAAD